MIGDDVLKSVAARVTVDGSALEGSPVEVILITIDNNVEILDHARRKKD